MKTDVTTQNQPPISKLVEHIVKLVHPIRIILFGSAARGEMTAHSDLDLLVVVPEGTHRRHTAQTIHRSLIQFSQPVDVVVATEADLLRHRDNFSLVYYSALREGKEVYASAG